MFSQIWDNVKVWSQRKMKKRPQAECNTTSSTQALTECNYDVSDVNGMMYPDYLMSLLETAEAKKKLQEFDPGATYNTWNSSDMLAWVVTKVQGEGVVKVVRASLQELVYHLIYAGVATVGGSFTKTGHFVTITGFNTTQDIKKIKKVEDVLIKCLDSFVIKDPYGNYYTGYRDENGDDIKMPISDFSKIVYNNQAVKKMQFFYKKGENV